jgi:hypothetical protein
MPYFGRDFFLYRDALYDTRAVADHCETDLAVKARGLDPAAQGHGFAGVLAEAPDFSADGHATL